MNPIHYKAIIKQVGTMNAAYVEFPYSVQDLFGKKGQVKIKALFDDKVNYRGVLAKMGKNESHFLGLRQDVRKTIGKSFGDEVDVKLWEDKEERTVEIPKDVNVLFKKNKKPKELFDKMSYTHQKEYIQWIQEAKKPETRENRKLKMIDMILAGKKGI